MPNVIVKVPTTNSNVASVIGWIVTTKRKPDPSDPTKPPKRKVFVSDYDQASKNASGSMWVLTLVKREGPKIRRNVLHVTALDRRGRVIDSIIRTCKR